MFGNRYIINISDYDITTYIQWNPSNLAILTEMQVKHFKSLTNMTHNQKCITITTLITKENAGI